MRRVQEVLRLISGYSRVTDYIVSTLVYFSLSCWCATIHKVQYWAIHLNLMNSNLFSPTEYKFKPCSLALQIFVGEWTKDSYDFTEFEHGIVMCHP